MERAGFSKEEVDNIYKAIRIVTKGGRTIEESLEDIEKECTPSENIQYLTNFIKKSERGITMSKLRAAVVGVGHSGRWHAQKYKMIDGVELVGLCDLNKNRSPRFRPSSEFPAFFDLKDLIKEKVDSVTVAASTPAHYQIVKNLIENRIHVLVEKPIASTSAQATELCELAEKLNVKLRRPCGAL